VASSLQHQVAMGVFSKVAMVTLLAFMVASWVIFLAGVARTEDRCVNGLKEAESVNPQYMDALQAREQQNMNLGRRMLLSHGRTLLVTKTNACGMLLSFPWWTVFFQLLILIFVFASYFSASFAQTFGETTRGFMYINTALLCVVAGLTVPAAFGLQSSLGAWPVASRVLSAGVILTLISNFVWILMSRLHMASQTIARK